MIFTMRNLFRLLPAILCLATLPLLAQTTTVTKSVLHGLPEDTSIVIRLNSGRGLIDKIKASPFGDLRTHPEFKGFFDMVASEIEKGAKEGEAELGFNPLDLLDSLDGEVTFAIGGIEKIVSAIVQEIGAGGSGEDAVKPGDIPLLITANARSKAGSVRKKFAKIFSKIEEEEGVKSSIRDFHGGKITTFKAPKNADLDLSELYFGELGSTFFFGINKGYFEKTFATLAGQEGASLTKSTDFIETSAQLGGTDADLLIYVNTKSIFGSIKKNLQSNPLFQVIYNMIETKIIGTSLKNFATTTNFAPDGIDAVSFINTDGKREGLLGLFDGPAFSAADVAKGVPPTVDSFTAMNFDFPKFYQLVREVANMAMGMAQGAPGIDVEQIIEGQFQIKPSKVFGALGNKMAWFARASEGAADDPLGLGTFGLQVDLKDKKTIHGFLKKLPALLSQTLFLSGIRVEDYNDTEIFHFSSEGPVAAIAGNKLVLTINAKFLKDLINRSGKADAKSLADDATYKKITSGYPAKVSSVNFARKEYYKQSMSTLSALAAESGEEIPDLSAIFDILGDSGGYAVWNEKGYLSKARVPFKKKSK